MPTPEAATGRIHDIGYRHHDGVRLGRGWVFRSLFVESALGAYGLGRSVRSKVVPVLLLAAMCLPAVIISVFTAAGSAAAAGPPRLPIAYTVLIQQLQVVITVFVAAQAPAAVSRDLRHRVLALYFSRPLSRPDYVAAKLAALSVAVLVLIAAPLVIMAAGALLAGVPVADQALPLVRGVVEAVVLAVVLSALSLLIAALTPRRGLGVAAIVSVLVVLAGLQSAATGIATTVGAAGAAWFGLLSPYSLVDGAVGAVLGGDAATPVPGVLGGAVFVVLTVVLVAGCWLALLARYRRVALT